MNNPNSTPHDQASPLFRHISQGLEYKLKKFKIDYTGAEFVFMRNQVLQMMRNMGITEESFDGHRHFFTTKDGEFIALNRLYKTDYSSADYYS